MKLFNSIILITLSSLFANDAEANESIGLTACNEAIFKATNLTPDRRSCILTHKKIKYSFLLDVKRKAAFRFGDNRNNRVIPYNVRDVGEKAKKERYKNNYELPLKEFFITFTPKSNGMCGYITDKPEFVLPNNEVKIKNPPFAEDMVRELFITTISQIPKSSSKYLMNYDQDSGKTIWNNTIKNLRNIVCRCSKVNGLKTSLRGMISNIKNEIEENGTNNSLNKFIDYNLDKFDDSTIQNQICSQ